MAGDSNNPRSNNMSSEISAQAAEVARSGDVLWAAYQKHGAGELPAGLYDDFATASKALGELLEDAESSQAEFQSELEILNDLAYRCQHHPQGLNFISGEGGLVPRKDLHQAMERALTRFREC